MTKNRSYNFTCTYTCSNNNIDVPCTMAIYWFVKCIVANATMFTFAYM